MIATTTPNSNPVVRLAPPTWINFAADWTRSDYYFFPVPSTGANYYTVWFAETIVPSLSFIELYGWLAGGGSGAFSLTLDVEINGVLHAEVLSAPVATGTNVFVAVRYTASSGLLELVINGSVVASATLSLAALPLMANDYLLGDGAGLAGGRIGFDRLWQAKLSTPELVLESGSPVAVRQTNLLADTPLPGQVNLYDISGNHRDWFALAPLIYTTSVQFSGQYGGAVGLYGGFCRSDVNNAPGIIRLAVGATAPSGGNSNTILWVRGQFASSGPPWPPNPLCEIEYIWVEWLENNGARQFTDNLTGYPMQYGALVGGIGNCNVNQTCEIRFRLGTFDVGTGLHAADGYWELLVNGLVQASRVNIPLGMQGFASWDDVIICPAGGLDNVGPPLHKVPISNGGLTRLYINNKDEYGFGASTIVNNDFALMVDASTWWDVDPNAQWVRWSNQSPNYGPPKGSEPPSTALSVQNDPSLTALNADPTRCCTNNYMMSQYVTIAPLGSAPPAAIALRMTQLPVEAAYDYGMLQPFVKGSGLDWVTPPKALT